MQFNILTSLRPSLLWFRLFFTPKMFLPAAAFLLVSWLAPGYLPAQSLIYYPPASAPDPVTECGTDDRITVTFNLTAETISHFDLILLDGNGALLADGELYLTDSIQPTFVFEICVPAGGCSSLLLVPHDAGFNGDYEVELENTTIATGSSFSELTIIGNIGLGNACDSAPHCEGYLSLVGLPAAGTTPVCGTTPAQSPCAGNFWRYCAIVTNLGQDPIQPGTQVVFELDGDMTFDETMLSESIAENPCGMNFIAYDAGFHTVTFETTQPINSLNSCEICIDVEIADNSFGPWTTGAHLYANCSPGADDDAASLEEISQCSCDPNDMRVSPAGCGPLGSIANERLTYHIRFQNLGAGPAHDVVIRDVLDGDLDIGSLQLIASSHPITGFAMNAGNELVVSFEGIELPWADFNEAASNGYVVFSIRPQADIDDGTVIENFADIYFDNNDPVTTNTVINTVFAGFTPPVVDITADQFAAPDGCALLTANVVGGVAPYTYSWNSGQSTQDITVCPTEPTFYQVKVTDANACVRASWEEVNTCSDDIYCGKQGDKIQVCHLPPGNPAGRFTLCVNPDALENHLAHGDFVGPCDQSGCILPPPVDQLSAAAAGTARLHTYPNPVTDRMVVEFYLPAAEEIHLDLLDLNGRSIRRLSSGNQADGLHRLDWDGLDATGRQLPNGLYLLRLRTSQDLVERKVIVLR